MKNIYLLFIHVLLFAGACEVNNKNAALSKEVKFETLKNDSCLVTYVLVVNLPDSTYNKKCLRKALAYSIDRDKLFENSPANYSVDENGNVLPGGPAIYGVVQPVFPEYDVKGIKGYTLNIDSAKYYLKKSNFPLSKELDFFTMSSGESSYCPACEMSWWWHEYIGLTDQQRWTMPTSTLFSNAFSGKNGIYCIPLMNPYKQPEKYLSIFYSKNDSPNPYTNTRQMAYKSIVFDMFYEAGMHASSRGEAITNFKAAEQVLIDDAVIIPLWYGKRAY